MTHLDAYDYMLLICKVQIFTALWTHLFLTSSRCLSLVEVEVCVTTDSGMSMLSHHPC